MAAKHATITTTIQQVERMASSKSGNPRYKVTTPVGTWPTSPDSTAGYALSAGMAARPAVLQLDGRGRIFGVEIDYSGR